MVLDRVSLVARIFDQVDAKLPDRAESPVVRDAATYTDPVRFQRELECLFRGYPMCIAYSGELPEPGDYKTAEIAGMPIIVVRGADGRIRAFRNACLHRGAPLLDDRGSGLKRFSCPFHGWAYDNEGALAMVPSRSCFPDLSTRGGRCARSPPRRSGA